MTEMYMGVSITLIQVQMICLWISSLLNDPATQIDNLEVSWSFTLQINRSTSSRHIRGSAAQRADAVTSLVFAFRQDFYYDLIILDRAKVCVELLL